MNKIIVVDFGVGNLRSVIQSLKKVAPDADIKISNEPNLILNADRIVLPGQGAMPDCMKSLKIKNLNDVLFEVLKNKPLLGICIGLQILFDYSNEGNTNCLGFISGKVNKFDLKGKKQPDGSLYKVPQIGWNNVTQIKSHPMWIDIPDNSFFYFIHSYFVEPLERNIEVGQTCYGKSFCSAISYENIFATQFHPEKSALVGLQLYKNFVNWRP